MFPDPFALQNPDERPTWPPAGTLKLVIEDRYEPLFLTATWTITAMVGTRIMAKSSEADKSHSSGAIRRWARQFIRSRYEALRGLGVDADAEYLKWGGKAEDLHC